MTPDEVRAAAGLIPFADHAGVGGRRGTGRTTRVLCEALAAASEGRRVHVVAARGERRVHLERQARDLARKAGLSLEKVRILAPQEPHKLLSLPREDLVLHDHY
ncbi:hypothetical protein [Sorangium sp. So ce128]|uniref:hypothetical protein n=1 Tax=Sorangium sp. So ce128 TaxID=3133281 RepID=UPI003F62F9A7